MAILSTFTCYSQSIIPIIYLNIVILAPSDDIHMAIFAPF